MSHVAENHRSQTPALEIMGLSKSYGLNMALDGVDLQIRAGEIRALLGQNGSGKSTLVKALTGVHSPDSGNVKIFGKELSFPVRAAHEHGVAVIHQDLGLIDSMTVLENLGINAGYGTRTLGWIRNLSEEKRYLALMDLLGFSIPLHTTVAALTPAQRSLVAILRAMRVMTPERTPASAESSAAAFEQVFVLDEPTAALSGHDTKLVLGLMRRMADLGAGVLFISHRLAEVEEICDTVTVLRSGRVVADGTTAGLSRADIVASMLGRRLEEYFPRPGEIVGTDARLVVSNLSGQSVHGVDFAVRGGEVLGVTGLAGMGQDELLRLIFGADARRSGTVALDGADVDMSSPRSTVGAGIVLVPGNRLRDGCWVEGNARENLTIANLAEFANKGGLTAGAERIYAQSEMIRFAVSPPDPEAPIGSFSGGNQQKIMLAKWLRVKPQVILLDEPTQGVDPGAARDLLENVLNVAREGAVVVIASGDHEQLAEVCHRVLVLVDGKVSAELSGELLTESALVHACEG
jgi:ribose transport system ATP-binding protein